MLFAKCSIGVVNLLVPIPILISFKVEVQLTCNVSKPGMSLFIVVFFEMFNDAIPDATLFNITLLYVSKQIPAFSVLDFKISLLPSFPFTII